MTEKYAIINKEGFLENIIILNEADAASWIIPDGAIIKKASDVDFTNLQVNSTELVKYTAEEWLKNQDYGPLQIVVLVDIERQLFLNGKTSEKMTAVRVWMNSILSEYITGVTSKSDWISAPYTFDETAIESFAILNE